LVYFADPDTADQRPRALEIAAVFFTTFWRNHERFRVRPFCGDFRMMFKTSPFARRLLLFDYNSAFRDMVAIPVDRAMGAGTSLIGLGYDLKEIQLDRFAL
jgi:hypothetical protein